MCKEPGYAGEPESRVNLCPFDCHFQDCVGLFHRIIVEDLPDGLSSNAGVCVAEVGAASSCFLPAVKSAILAHADVLTLAFRACWACIPIPVFPLIGAATTLPGSSPAPIVQAQHVHPDPVEDQSSSQIKLLGLDMRLRVAVEGPNYICSPWLQKGRFISSARDRAIV
ncbi:MAG: hypothetical protein AABY22_10125, partial [Nanoarchaeota archaeon]